MNGLGLCAGLGGLELGLRRALPYLRFVALVEREVYCVARLAELQAAGHLDPAPIYADLESFDGGPWYGVVDFVAAGWPCQPVSTAGKRVGTDDDRWLWPHIARIVAEVEPRLVFLENVPGLLTANAGRALHEVVGDLAALGFVGRYDLFRASDVGAPHRRERLFILGVAHGMADAGLAGFRGVARSGEVRGATPRADGAPLERQRDGHAAGSGGADVAPVGDSDRAPEDARPAAGRSRSAACERRGEAEWPPGPSDAAGWERWLAAGGPAPAEPVVRGGADGLPERMDPHRRDRLAALGNAVVPAQAELAFRVLAERAGIA